MKFWHKEKQKTGRKDKRKVTYSVSARRELPSRVQQKLKSIIFFYEMCLSKCWRL